MKSEENHRFSHEDHGEKTCSRFPLNQFIGIINSLAKQRRSPLQATSHAENGADWAGEAVGAKEIQIVYESQVGIRTF